MAYCTTEDLRAHLGDTGDRLDEALLQAAIDAATGDVDEHTGRRFDLDVSATARVFDGCGSSRILIDDIGSLTGLAVETSADGSTWSAVAVSDYEPLPLNANSNPASAYAWWWLAESPSATAGTWAWARRVRVTARWGWSAVPAQVKQATILRAVALFKRKDAPHGVAGFDGFGVVRLRQDPDVEALLQPFVRSFGIA